MKNPSTTPAAVPGGADASAPSIPGSSGERFERILRLQQQATYPLNPVAAVLAQSQLAHVEVPWLTGQLQRAQTRLQELTGDASFRTGFRWIIDRHHKRQQGRLSGAQDKGRTSIDVDPTDGRDIPWRQAHVAP